MTFRVETTVEAERDGDAILNGCFRSMPVIAGFQWFTTLQDSIESLADFPKRCLLAPESDLFAFEVRQLLYGQTPHVYRILFTTTGNTVYVLHVRHARRRPLKH
jgi:plasmid stabilization system protein ParE